MQRKKQMWCGKQGGFACGIARFGLVALGCLFAHGGAAKPFDFVAIGDTAYNPPQDYATYEQLIKTINAVKPAFTIHVGDTWGVMDCTQAEHEKVEDYFDDYNHPVFYTPGDNEWVDCLKSEYIAAAGRFLSGQPTPEDLQGLQQVNSLDGASSRAIYGDGMTSLKTLRDVFFAKPRSQGGKTLPLVRQADVSDHKQMVENSHWQHEGVWFGTVHVPGSGNNFFINDEARALEAIARNRANLDWLKALFAEATANDAKAVVVATHAALFVDGQGGDFTGQAVRGGRDSPFQWIVQAIRDLGSAFGKPVLLVHGDFHEFEVDRPFMMSQGEAKPPKAANITRLQVFGAPEIKAVRVSVEPDTPWVFGFTPLHD